MPRTSEVTHLVLDCDGVLVDSEAISIEIEAALLTAAGFPITADRIAERYVGMTYTATLEALEEEFDRPLPRTLVPEIEQRVIEAFPTQLCPVAGVETFLNESVLPRCIASSSELERVLQSLALTGLARFFDPEMVFSGQMVERSKPAPDLFLFAADRLGAEPSSCLVVEDSPHGVTAAVRAGMPVVGLLAGRHAHASLADRLLAAGADQVVETFEQLAKLV